MFVFFVQEGYRHPKIMDAAVDVEPVFQTQVVSALHRTQPTTGGYHSSSMMSGGTAVLFAIVIILTILIIASVIRRTRGCGGRKQHRYIDAFVPCCG